LSLAVFASMHYLGILGGANADLGFVNENGEGTNGPSFDSRAILRPVKPFKGDLWARVRKADRAIPGYSIS
jgi:hypothetical protein